MRISWSNIARSSLRATLTLFGVAVVVFLLFNVLPGDPARLLAGKYTDEHQLSAIREDMGMNLGVGERFLYFINDLSPLGIRQSDELSAWSCLLEIPLPGNHELVLKWPYFGRSFARGVKVSELLLEGLPESLALVFSALLFAALAGIPLGIAAARNPGGTLDTVLLMIASAGMAIPSFVAAMIIAWVFGFLLNSWLGLPISGSLYAYDYYKGEDVLVLSNLILPALALSIRPLSLTGQLVRNTMMDVLGQNYIRTARAKGLPERIILFKHGLVNAINPVLNEFGAWITALMAGSVFVEFVFGWKGWGHVLLTAIEYMDFPVVVGLTLVLSATFIFIQWLLRIITPIFDPTLTDK